MIRAILFDKDGTFTDFRATWETWMGPTVSALAGETGVPAADVAETLGFDLGSGRFRSDALFVTAPNEITVRTLAPVAGWSPARLGRWLSDRARDVTQVEVTDLPTYLAGLRARGLRLGVLTNAEEAEAEAHLDRLGASPHLDRVIACDSGFGPKPAPHGAAHFADSLGLSRTEVALVGDGMPDMLAAKGAGLVAVGVLTGTLTRGDLAPHACAVLPDITHVPDWLDRQAVA